MITPAILFAQTFPKVTYNAKNCSLSIKAGKWKKSGSKELLPITAVLFNNSNDTLKYASELCFEGEFAYLPYTSTFSIDGGVDDCLKNWPITVIIPPHSSKIQKLNVIKKHIGSQQVDLQMVATLELVNIDVHLATLNVMLAHKDLKAFNDKLSMYEEQNTHTFRSNILKI